MWSLDVADRGSVHPAIWRVAADVERKYGITVRNMRKKDMEAEIGRFLQVYNAAWERNWGFVPLTEEEVRHYAKDLKPMLDENWAFIAEKDGEPVGAALTLPDYNQVLSHLNGRLLPFGWAKFALVSAQDRPGPGVRPRGQARVPAHRGGGQAVRDALGRRRAHAAGPGRDRLDAREQQADEPCDGAHGRQGGPHVPRVRAACFEHDRSRLSPCRRL